MSAAFTPGPWCWEQCGDKVDAPVVGVAFLKSDTDCKNPLSGCLREFDDNGDPVEYYRESIAYEIESCDGYSASANAALIAAAPELYAELQQFVNGVETRMIDSPADETLENITRRAKAALAKARGQ